MIMSFFPQKKLGMLLDSTPLHNAIHFTTFLYHNSRGIISGMDEYPEVAAPNGTQEVDSEAIHNKDKEENHIENWHLLDNHNTSNSKGDDNQILTLRKETGSWKCMTHKK